MSLVNIAELNIEYKKVCLKNEEGQAITEYALMLAMIMCCISVFAFLSLIINNHFIASTCRINCAIFESQYEAYLIEMGYIHSDALFSQYVESFGNGICPENYPITYIDGSIQCSGHLHDKKADVSEDEIPSEPVPFL